MVKIMTNLWHDSESYIWVRLWGVSRCHVPLALISEFDVASFSLAWREFAELYRLLMSGMQTNMVFFMAMLLGPDFLKWYSTLAKMEPELPYKVHNCHFPSVPFREGLHLEWSPSQWHRYPLSHKIQGLGRAFPYMFDSRHMCQVALCTSRTMSHVKRDLAGFTHCAKIVLHWWDVFAWDMRVTESTLGPTSKIFRAHWISVLWWFSI